MRSTHFLEDKIRVEPTGVKNKIMLIGINPGCQPMECQDIWETDYGKFIEQLLFLVQLSRDDIWMTNLYKYKTPGNRPLRDDEIYIGRAELIREIAQVHPRLIVLMGKVVIGAIGGILNAETQFMEIPIFSINHPSFARRFWHSIADKYVDNFKKIKKIYERQLRIDI